MSLSVKVVKFSAGERFAHIIDSETLLPHFESTIYNIAMLRGRQLATATIERALRAIKIFLLFCDMRGISLSTRMQKGFLFQEGELDHLLRLCRMPMEHLDAMAAAVKIGGVVCSPKRLQLIPTAKSDAEVSGHHIMNRIIYIREYVDYLAGIQCDRFVQDHDNYLLLSGQRKTAYNKLTASLPKDKGRNVVNQRMGLTEEEQQTLWEFVDPDYSGNVWIGRHCRVRNELMTKMFVKLGIRRGELAGISVRDIDFRARTLLIRRRADDKNDSRKTQPNAKTLDRYLPLSDDLLQRIQSYVAGERKAQAAANKHPFLFVANGGRPLGLRAVNKIFEVLAKRCGEFAELHPHLFRHTFNENLSTNLDAKQVPPAEEEPIRSELNGWKRSSGTAATYTKRTIQRRAREASLELQGKQPAKPIINDE